MFKLKCLLLMLHSQYSFRNKCILSQCNAYVPPYRLIVNSLLEIIRNSYYSKGFACELSVYDFHWINNNLLSTVTLVMLYNINMHNKCAMSGLLCSMAYVTTHKAFFSSSISQTFFLCAPSVSFQVLLFDGVISCHRS